MISERYRKKLLADLLKDAPPRPKSPRKVTREERIRYFERNGRHYKILMAWHLISADEENDAKWQVKSYYIYVYRGGDNIPFHRWRWIEHPDGTWNWV